MKSQMFIRWLRFPLPLAALDAITSIFLSVNKTVNGNLRVEGRQLLFPAVRKPYPLLFFGGSSDAGIDVASALVDTYLTWGKPPAAVAEKLGRSADAAAKRGRKLSYGIRLYVIVRETAAAACAVADDLIRYVDDATIAKAQGTFAKMDSIGQRRMAALHNGTRNGLEVSPNLWAGVGLVRGGAGTALVGDPDSRFGPIRGC